MPKKKLSAVFNIIKFRDSPLSLICYNIIIYSDCQGLVRNDYILCVAGRKIMRFKISMPDQIQGLSAYVGKN